MILERPFYPALTWLINLRLRIDKQLLPGEESGTYFLLIDVEDDRFNATGAQHVCRRVAPRDLPEWDQTLESWPPQTPGWEWRKVKALPENRLLCGPGKRQDVRAFRIDDSVTDSRGWARESPSGST